MTPHPHPAGEAAGEAQARSAAAAMREPDAKTEVMIAAAGCFMSKGFAATSIDDVARAMGATKGRVYHYWRAKLDLFLDVVRFSLELIHDKVAAAEGQGAADDRMGRMIRAHLASILEDQPFHRCALQGVDMHLRGASTPEQRAELRALIALRDRHEALFARVLREGLAEGVFAPGPDPKMTTRALLPTLNGPVFWYRPREGETRADRDDLIEGIAAFALRGLGAGSGRKNR